jgi:hypothetical protein
MGVYEYITIPACHLGHKYRVLAIHVGLMTLLCKKLLLQNPKKWKLDGLELLGFLNSPQTQ